MSTERKEFESWVARVRLPYCDTPADRAQQWIGWQGCRASPAAAVPVDALPAIDTPELREKFDALAKWNDVACRDSLIVHIGKIARAAVEADRARQGEPVAWGELEKLVEDYARHLVNVDFWSGMQKSSAILMPAYQSCDKLKAAIYGTKAAAPDDAPTTRKNGVVAEDAREEKGEAEAYLRGKYGAYRGHFAWRELEAAFNAGRSRRATSVPAIQGTPEKAVAWALVSPKGGIKKVSITRASIESRMARWLEEWPDNTPTIRPLVYGDAAPSHPSEAKAGEDA